MEDFVAQRSSQEHKDAADLWELFNNTKNRILDAQDKADEVESEPRRGRPPKVSSYSTCDPAFGFYAAPQRFFGVAYT